MRIFPLPIIAWTLCDRKVFPSGVMNCTSLESYLSGAWRTWCDVIKLLSVFITWQISNDLDFVCYYRHVAFQEEGVVRFLAWTLNLHYSKLEYFYGLEIDLKLISLSKHRRCHFFTILLRVRRYAILVDSSQSQRNLKTSVNFWGSLDLMHSHEVYKV